MKFFKAIGRLITLLAFMAAASLLYAFYIEPQLLVSAKYEYKTALVQNDIRVVLFTDTHFGEKTKEGRAEKIVSLINTHNPDIVIFGGDLLDNYSRDKAAIKAAGLGQALSKINAPVKAAVYGNHDYGGGAALAVRDIWETAGFSILTNENLVLNDLGVELIGMDELFMGDYRPELAKPSSGLLPIVICHEPDTAKELIGSIETIMLSGHTHGGQILLPFLTQRALPPGGKAYRRGEYSVNGGTLYVSSGIGTTSIHARFLNIPEIVVLDIKAA